MSSASVAVADECVGAVGLGLCVLVGVTHDDGPAQVSKLARKLHGLRIFDDDAGVMNLSVAEVGGSVLVVSQFTLYGDAARGRRPSWTGAARSELAEPLIDQLVQELDELGVAVETGHFRADMVVSLVNQGPVTMILDV